MIYDLKPNEVFIFGSNGTGFHGAGGAGLACRGDSLNNWRNDDWFRKAMNAPAGSPDRIGKWAVYGVARGFQQGRAGKSYAIQTVTRPGARRSISLDDIKKQIEDLASFSEKNPDWTFLISPIGEGYAGYSRQEMDATWASVKNPGNWKFVRPETENT